VLSGRHGSVRPARHPRLAPARPSQDRRGRWRRGSPPARSGAGPGALGGRPGGSRAAPGGAVAGPPR
jgi:hypothetical protein